MFNFLSGNKGIKNKPTGTEVKRTTGEGDERLEVISHKYFTREMYNKLHDEALNIGKTNEETNFNEMVMPEMVDINEGSREQILKTKQEIMRFLEKKELNDLLELINNEIERKNDVLIEELLAKKNQSLPDDDKIKRLNPKTKGELLDEFQASLLKTVQIKLVNDC